MLTSSPHIRPVVSVVLGSYQRCAFLKETLSTVRQELADLPHELIVVDGGSSDGSVEWLLRQKDVLLILQHNRGTWRGKPIQRQSWGYFMNLGFRSARGKYVCMISDDCLVVPGAIRDGVKHFESLLESGSRVGALAFYWRNWPEQAEYVVGVTWGNNLFVNHGLYLNEALRSIEYAEENEYRFYHADGDLCLRLKEAGWACLAAPSSFIEHYSHANAQVRKSNNTTQKRDWDTYVRKWSNLGVPDEDWLRLDHHDVHRTARRFLGIREVLTNSLKASTYAVARHMLKLAGWRREPPL